MKLIRVGDKIINLDSVAWAQPDRDPDDTFVVEVHFIGQASIENDTLQLRGREANNFMAFTKPLLIILGNNGETNGKES